MVEVKFCGLTRPEDAARAVELGAGYCGVIFAGGPRLVTAKQAREVFAPVTGTAVQRVGVFGAQSAEEISRIADEVSLDVLQLHGGASRDLLIALRQDSARRIWAVARVAPDAAGVPDESADWIAAGAAGVVLDAAVAGQLGGTGVVLDWQALAPAAQELRERVRVVLAGGLRPEHVAQAVALVMPDVVDVSSGVESAPGVKDPERMRLFAEAARRGEVR